MYRLFFLGAVRMALEDYVLPIRMEAGKQPWGALWVQRITYTFCPQGAARRRTCCVSRQHKSGLVEVGAERAGIISKRADELRWCILCCAAQLCKVRVHVKSAKQVQLAKKEECEEGAYL